MKYDAITLDTSIFDRYDLALEAGMLKQMEQFQGGNSQFVLSEIVIREVHRHLKLPLHGSASKLTRTGVYR